MKHKKRVIKKLREYFNVTDNVTDKEVLKAARHGDYISRAKFSIAMEDLKKAFEVDIKKVCEEVARKVVADFQIGKRNDKH